MDTEQEFQEAATGILEKAASEIAQLSDDAAIATRVLAVIEWTDMESGEEWVSEFSLPTNLAVTDRMGFAMYLYERARAMLQWTRKDLD